MAKVSDVYYSLGCSSQGVKAEEETSKVRQRNVLKNQPNCVPGRWEAGLVLLQNRLLQLVQPDLPVHRTPPRRPRLSARPLAGHHLLPILETVTPPSLLHNICTSFRVLPFLFEIFKTRFCLAGLENIQACREGI